MAERDRSEKRSTTKRGSFRAGTAAPDQEIVQIIEEAARLPSVHGIRAPTYTTLFGPIAVTGLRVSEALALDNDDVDLASGVLTIR
jgi:integrase/recombinase XerD